LNDLGVEGVAEITKGKVLHSFPINHTQWKYLSHIELNFFFSFLTNRESESAYFSNLTDSFVWFPNDYLHVLGRWERGKM
jgi:hypothetical protein